jgi:uncharacterized protein
MEFRGMEGVVVDVLRTPELQRLRRIRQLGLAHLVFPGAEHSRLSHSLGAAWLAIRFGRQLADVCRGYLVDSFVPSEGAIRDLAVAALCHDLGHGPLSHAWEREIVGESFSLDKWCTKLGLEQADKTLLQGSKWHEVVTSGFLAWEDGDLHNLLESHEAKFSDRLRYLLKGQYYLKYLPRLLASDVDVDRADFLRRDTHQSGVAYGRYDLDWLISTLTLGETEQGDLVVGFDQRKAVRVIQQFLIARQALYDTVYYHKTVHSAEGMVALFLRRLRALVHDGQRIEASDLARPYIQVISGEALSQHELLGLDDFSLSVLIDTVTKAKDADITLCDLGKRILARDLFKLIPCDRERVAEFVSRPDGYSRIYEAIKPYCAGKPEYYLVRDDVPFDMFCRKRDEVGYLVECSSDGNRRATPLAQHPDLRSYASSSRFIRLFTLSEAVDEVRHLIG